ncbi:hypothetical protein PULV_a4256 [Pseudoalteromonas ulvae UL12]|nr:hypothetical protein [Pseudoalteromonas ulvae UL12]
MPETSDLRESGKLLIESLLFTFSRVFIVFESLNNSVEGAIILRRSQNSCFYSGNHDLKKILTG